MIVTMTYNQIVDLLANIAVAHKQLKGFGAGELWEINGDPKNSGIYPELWLVPVNAVAKLNTIEHTVRLLVYDLVNKDETNENDVLSDALQILLDVVKVLRYESDNYTLLNEPTLEPFTERFDDEVSGWSAEFVIEVNFANNDCDMPMDSFVSPGIVQGGIVLPNDFLTCGDLVNCPTIETINETLISLQEQIDNIPPFDCDVLATCPIIIDIQQDIVDIQTEIDNLSQYWTLTGTVLSVTDLSPDVTEVNIDGKITVDQTSYSEIARFKGFFSGSPFDAFEIDLNGNTISHTYSKVYEGLSLGSATGFLSKYLAAPNDWTMEFASTTIKNASSQPAIYFNQATPDVTTNFALLGSGTTDTYLNATSAVYFTRQGSLIGDYNNTRWNFNLPILPNVDDTFDIGSATKRWKDLYLGSVIDFFFDLEFKKNGDANSSLTISDTSSLFKSANARIFVDLSNSGHPIHRYMDGSGNIMGSISAASNNFYFDATLGAMFFRGTAGIASSIYNNGQWIINDQTGSANNAQLEVRNNLNTRVGLMVTGTTSQSGDLQQWRDVTPTVKSFVDSVGLHKYSADYSGSYDNRTLVDKEYVDNSLPTSVTIVDKFTLTVDGLGGVVSTGSKGFVHFPYACTITNWYITADQSSSIVLDLKRSGTSIIGAGNKPTLSSVQRNNAAVSGWTSVAISANDELEWNVDSATTILRGNITVYTTRTINI